MAIVFNTYRDMSDIFTDDGGVNGANNAAATVFDYFPNNAAVGDCLYLAVNATLPNNRWFRNIKFYVGTAFAADAVTFVWEYSLGKSGGAFSKTSTYWSTLTVGNGDALKNTGEQIVTFTPPDDWEHFASGNPHVQQCIYVRCRITAITNPTEGGAQSTQKVQAGDNDIVVTGYSSGTPCTFADIYAADVAGSWGVVTNPSAVQYIFTKVGLILGDGATATYFTDTTKQIYHHLCYGRYPLIISASAVVNYGEKSTQGHGKNGCSVIMYPRDTDEKYAVNCTILVGASGTFNYYDTTFQHLTHNKTSKALGGDGTGYYDLQVAADATVDNADSTVEDAYTAVFSTANLTMTRPAFINSTIALRNGAALSDYVIDSPLLGDISTAASNYMFYAGADLYIKNPKMLTTGTAFRAYSGAEGADLFLLNSPRLDFVTVSPYTSFLYYYFEFDITVVDQYNVAISGANVTITNVSGGAVFSGTTDANGVITQQKILYKKVTFGDASSTIYGPFNLVIEKAGYATYRFKAPIGEKTDLIIALQPSIVKVGQSLHL